MANKKLNKLHFQWILVVAGEGSSNHLPLFFFVKGPSPSQMFSTGSVLMDLSNKSKTDSVNIPSGVPGYIMTRTQKAWLCQKPSFNLRALFISWKIVSGCSLPFRTWKTQGIKRQTPLMMSSHTLNWSFVFNQNSPSYWCRVFLWTPARAHQAGDRWILVSPHTQPAGWNADFTPATSARLTCESMKKWGKHFAAPLIVAPRWDSCEYALGVHSVMSLLWMATLCLYGEDILCSSGSQQHVNTLHRPHT